MTAPPKAIIFDCDGTLVDSMPAHYAAWVRTLEPLDLQLDEDRFYRLGGWPTLKVAELLIAESGLNIEPEVLAERKESRFEAEIPEIRIIPPVVSIVDEYFGRIPLAVGTGAERRICRLMLEAVGLLDRFDTIVSAEDVRHHKPAPDTYFEAARRIAVPPADCLVYEDTDPGVESGRAAGMRVIDVRDFFTPQRMS
jgi:beta-phosphoglucomutase-like phosphatase (HAD superfamily)